MGNPIENYSLQMTTIDFPIRNDYISIVFSR